MVLWENPEFIRHVRAGLRRNRALGIGITCVVLECLIGMLIDASNQPDRHYDFIGSDIAGVWFVTMLVIQSLALVLGAASANLLNLPGERVQKTFDFLRTTALTPGELLAGKLFGAPITVYFGVLCTLPLSLVAGMVAGIPILNLTQIYIVVLVFALLISLLAQVASLFMEKTQNSVGAASLIFPVIFFLAIGGGVGRDSTPLSPVRAIYGLMHSGFTIPGGYETSTGTFENTTKFFGVSFPFVPLTLALYLAIGAWFVLMMVRNIKHEVSEIKLLTTYQALGFACFLHLLFF